MDSGLSAGVAGRATEDESPGGAPAGGAPDTRQPGDVVRRVLTGPAGEVELVLLRVAAHAAAARRDVELLDAAERARAAAFVREDDRNRYRVAHLALRRELGARLGLAPAEVTFVREPCPCCGEPHGRPAVPGAPLHFSLSHAEDLVLLACAPVPVGVDVERLPSLHSADTTIRALHPTERREYAALPATLRPAAFARCWTRKEAYLKGTGSGLGEDPAVTYVGTGLRPAEVPGWRLWDVPLPAEPGRTVSPVASPATASGPPPNAALPPPEEHASQGYAAAVAVRDPTHPGPRL